MPVAALFGVMPALQLYVALGVVELPCSVAVALVQVIVALFAFTLALGTSVSVVTFTVAVEEQPVAGSVTVSVYTPDEVAVPVAVLPGVTPADQLKVALGVVDEPCSVAEVVRQVMLMLALATAMFGNAPFIITATLAVSEHPLYGSVTVSVYTPAPFTVPEDVLFGVTPVLQL